MHYISRSLDYLSIMLRYSGPFGLVCNSPVQGQVITTSSSFRLVLLGQATSDIRIRCNSSLRVKLLGEVILGLQPISKGGFFEEERRKKSEKKVKRKRKEKVEI
ncbi:hypothetical protein ACN42_g5974 [Penicillium freii]|uniref:Uncharacterized protein n=1 Tax=Penicillium freii TaxID=48697 RepID=A0A124GRG4_PENFR|nr:hypothetical protein ACN42_g5974 [Penicillium freii]